MENLAQHDGELRFLGHFLHKVALEAKAKIDAIPEDASVEVECEMIDAAIAPADAIAKCVLELPASGEHGSKIKARAQAWLNGDYWKEAA